MTQKENMNINCVKCNSNFKLSKSSFEQYQPSEMVCSKCDNTLSPNEYLLIQEYVRADRKAILDRITEPLRKCEDIVEECWCASDMKVYKAVQESLNLADEIIGGV